MDAPTPYVAAPGRPRRLRAGLWMLTALVALAAAGCDSGSTGELPAYEGERALDLLKVTQSFTPEIQWVGGRVAAVGVNRGTRAALDSTLVWMRSASGNEIGSFATVGLETTGGAVEQYGGTLQERLSDGQTYTFWIADAAAIAAQLDSTAVDSMTFADTTMTMRLVVRGQSGGNQVGAQFQIIRDERLTGDQLVVSWTPNVAFRQMAIRRAATGSFNDLIWWITVPDDREPNITSPIVIGTTPEGGVEQTPFTGFVNGTYFLWAATDAWNSSFSPNSPGYAWFRISACNFDPVNPCP